MTTLSCLLRKSGPAKRVWLSSLLPHLRHRPTGVEGEDERRLESQDELCIAQQ